jgi:hypothetical protein
MAISNNLIFRKTLSSLLGFDKYGMDRLRAVEWGRKYLWAIKFLERPSSVGSIPPEPFNDYFPASDVTLEVSNLESYIITMGQSEYKVPIRNGSKTLNITFFDDKDSTLMKWLRDWIELDILNEGKFISCLRDFHQVSDSFGVTRPVAVYRTVELVQLTPFMEETGVRHVLHVYPESNLEFSGESMAAAITYSMTFSIVGEEFEPSQKDKRSAVDKAKDIGIKTLGRFI